ncbi:hypothetical protein SAMN05421827_102223 [Pedobacter terrae]|uniref:Uncharacterized protein n=1 Tax=Pedobacter terrae TaxID=405671 RepID=A0A1G7Q8S9_9SPHI|nr:hypothetical protein [Pedobacter terrae]SDF94997.1 hypothetical protein SAMN05421827_102223 [Pedobacter terrae]
MKKNFLNAGSIKEQVPICTLLKHLGYKPAKINGVEHHYINVLKSAEIKSAFVVNEQLNIWYDRLTKRSGNIIDFGIAYWPDLNSEQVIEKISQFFQISKRPTGIQKTNGQRKRLAVKIPFYHIEEIKPVGCNVEITAYLQSQGLWEISIGHLKEVYYYVVDEKRRRKEFFAAGWQNENGGWEVRGKNFSGCLGHKGMTFIPGNESSLILFEDYIDYLSWKFANKLLGPSILILNSPEFVEAAKKRASKFHEVAVFFGKQHLNAEVLSAIQGINPPKIINSP